MRLGNILVGLTLLFASCVSTQPLSGQIGSVKTEEYTAGFEKKKSLDSLPPYTDTIQIPIQILKIGISEEVYEMYPELKDARVGMGVTNIVLEYLEQTGRFVFTEDKLEIKERMVNQFKASNKGFTENKVDGKGKIKLAILEDWIRTEYGNFTINEIKVAFKQMVANDFIDHYQNFSPAYFSQVMDRYKKKANEVRKMIPQERVEAIPHLTDLEIIDYSYQEYKLLENRTFDRLFNPLSVFTKLNSSGIKVWTKEDGALAKKKLMEIIHMLKEEEIRDR